MSEEKLLTVRDVALFLGISEKEVVELSEKGAIPAYKVGGVFLRFKREQILEFKKTDKSPPSKAASPSDYPLNDRISDFFYFNDFYILTVLVIIGLLIVIFQG